MLVHCHKTLADRMYPVAFAKTFASANDKGRGILRSSSKRQQETTYVGTVGLGQFLFFFSSALAPLPPPPPPSSPYGRLSYVVFVVDTVKDYSGGYKCQFSVREPVKNPQDWSNMAKSWTLVDKASGRILNMLKLPNKIGW